MQHLAYVGLLFVALCLLSEVDARPSVQKHKRSRQSWGASSSDHVYSYDDSPLYTIDDNPQQRDKSYRSVLPNLQPVNVDKPLNDDKVKVKEDDKKFSQDKNEDSKAQNLDIQIQKDKMKLDSDTPSMSVGVNEKSLQSRDFGNGEKAVSDDKANGRKSSLEGSNKRKANKENMEEDNRVTDEDMEAFLKETYGEKYPYGIFDGSYTEYEKKLKGFKLPREKGLRSDQKSLKEDEKHEMTSYAKDKNFKDDDSDEKESFGKDKSLKEDEKDKGSSGFETDDEKGLNNFGKDKDDNSFKGDEKEGFNNFGNDNKDKSFKENNNNGFNNFGNDDKNKDFKGDDKESFKFGKDEDDKSFMEDNKEDFKFGKDEDDKKFKKDNKEDFKFGKDEDNESFKEDNKEEFNKFGKDDKDKNFGKDNKEGFKFGEDKDDKDFKEDNNKEELNKFGKDDKDKNFEEDNKEGFKFGKDKDDKDFKEDNNKEELNKFGKDDKDKDFKDDDKELKMYGKDKSFKADFEKMLGDMPLLDDEDDTGEMGRLTLFGEDDTEGLQLSSKSKPVIDESGDIHLQRFTEVQGQKESEIQNLAEEPKIELKSEMDPYRTPFDSQTSPNPPTTKPTKVTPVAANLDRDMVDGHMESIPYENCDEDGDCAMGRVCLEGVCVCGDDTMCLGHKKPVCGSNGLLYPSHCELHRQACIQGHHIRIDHQATCLSGDGKGPEFVQGKLCEYKVRFGVEATLWGLQITFTVLDTLEKCIESCDNAQMSGGCVAFEYSASSKQCVLYDNKDDIVYRPNPDMIFYDQTRCKKQIDPRCEFEEVRVSAEQVFATCNIRTSTGKTLDQCKEACGNCHAFTYVPENGNCEVHNNKACTSMLDEKGVAHYVQKCDRSGMQCEYIEIIPGSAPFMCSTSSTTTENLVECHDACDLSSCEAFRYKTDGSGGCDLYFDKSCITMLDKRKENYYVRRCTNPEECDYEEVQRSNTEVCSIVSSSMDTIDQCRDACGQCVGFKFDYQTGGCNLYNEDSCLPDKKLNFYIIRCPAEKPKPSNPTVPAMIKMQVGGSVDTAQEKEDTPVGEEVIPQESSVIEGGDRQVGQAQTLTSDVKKPGPQEMVDETEDSSSEEYYDDDKDEEEEDDSDLTDLQKKILGVKPIMEAGESHCTEADYLKFKADLLRYHCVRFGRKDCDSTEVPNKDYIATLMFSYYDRDMDGSVQTQELWETQVINKFGKLSNKCTLVDIMMFDDSGDGIMNKEEFLKAFDIPNEVLRQKVEVIPVLATMGNGLEIQCGIHPTRGSEIIWERHTMDVAMVSFPDIAVFSDGTLYFDNVGVHHTGNYTCYDRDRPGTKQVQQLRVQMIPKVTVSPASQLLELDNLDISIHCHAVGIPAPKVSWEINEKPLPKIPHHYLRSHKNGTLSIYHTNYQRDTGAYKCVAENTAGKAEDVATVFIHKPNETKHEYSHAHIRESVYAFHKTGYNVYDPVGCATRRIMSPSFGNLKYIPEELDKAPSLCEDKKPCSWGHSINVKNKFIFVAQPYQNRVVVIDAEETMNPVEFVKTDKFPVKLHYIEHLDQVWVLCWNSDRNTGSKTIIVIRDASKDTRHHMVHTQPIGYRFDLVQDMFLPPQNDLDYAFHYGYVIHNEQRGLFKLDLDTMRYTKAVDLSTFDCVPQKVVFIPIGGHVVIKCIKKMMEDTRTLQILMDYVTDVPLANITMYGTPYVSPDSRIIATVDEVTGKVRVANIQEDGQIKKGIEVSVASAISDVTFFPSLFTTGYDLYMTSQDRAQAFRVNLVSGEVTVVKDAGEPRNVRVWPWSQSTRSIAHGNVFSHYLATPSKESLVVISGLDHHTHCIFGEMDSPDSVLFSRSHF